MSAWSDYRATGDKAELEVYRQECEADERGYWAELEEVEVEREAEEYAEYMTEKEQKNE